MPSTSSMYVHKFPVFLGLMCFLLGHMTFYLFSYSSLLFSLVVIYAAVFCIQFQQEVSVTWLSLKSQFYKNFMKGGFAPFNTSGWSNVVTDRHGNIIDSGNEEDGEDDDFDATDNIISRKKHRKKPRDDGVLVEKNDDETVCRNADYDNNVDTEKSKCV